MRILFCCQFYTPSVGGVQEVIQQLSERLVVRGHKVSVATTKLSSRDFTKLNGVEVNEFDVRGNWVSEMSGEIAEYQEFLLNGQFDVVMMYAAQQWTFDAAWPVLDKLAAFTVFVPCGFSGLYEPGYETYFQALPEVLKKLDHLVFNASKYRDIDFAREHGIIKFSVVPNGANEEVFNVAADPLFRMRHGIPDKSFIFLTVGSFTGLKGHLELVKAFERLKLPRNRHATLILNGNEVQQLDTSVSGLLGKFLALVKIYGFFYAVKKVMGRLVGSVESPKQIAAKLNESKTNKCTLVTDFPRDELTQAFITADLFVFASNLDYSPLVLFESAAAGTPFLSVNVGNAEEIAEWTRAGVICESTVDTKGYTHVNEEVLANSMEELMQQHDKLTTMGKAGKQNWSERLTWDRITVQYEQIFNQLISEH